MPNEKMKSLVVVGTLHALDHTHLKELVLLRERTEHMVIIIEPHATAKSDTVLLHPEAQRAVLMGLGVANDVLHISSSKSSEHVAKLLKKLQPTHFARIGKGAAVRPQERRVCVAHDITVLPTKRARHGTAVHSWFLENVTEVLSTDHRPWGNMDFHRANMHFWVKTIRVSPGQRTSLQSHASRAEIWVMVEGDIQAQVGERVIELKQNDIVTIPLGVVHRLSSRGGGTIFELAVGPNVREDDIVRYADDYNRT